METTVKRAGKLLLVLAALMLLTPLSAGVVAGAPEVTPPAVAAPGGAGIVETETRLGVLMAIGCGFFVRASIVTGGNIGAIVGAVATCGYMIFDGATTPD
jgi:hypothetical protein